jgi:hypothetical protein
MCAPNRRVRRAGRDASTIAAPERELLITQPQTGCPLKNVKRDLGDLALPPPLFHTTRAACTGCAQRPVAVGWNAE